MDAVSEGALFTNLGQEFHCTFRHFNIFFLASDVKDLADFLVGVWLRADDQGTIKQINWETMGRQIVCSSNFGDSSVGGHHDNWSLIRFKGSVKE